jgi:uncharacterized protein (TIGR03437 family)
MPKYITLTFAALLWISTSAAQAQPTFTISTVAGTGVAGYYGDGGPATNATLNQPYGMAPDAAGNLYIADDFNNRIRKVAVNGTITTLAGTGAAGFGGDGGPATRALLFNPIRVSFDAAGNLYIADSGNNRVRKVTPSGTISTVAGSSQGYSGDGGPATSALLYGPVDAVPDVAGNLFIVDQGNNVVRKIDTSGIITTVAGNGTPGYSGDGHAATAASLNGPTGVAVDASGDLFISDRGNNRIRKVSNGIITTVAGNGIAGYTGDSGISTSAELNAPVGISLDAAGNLYIAEVLNNRIRVLLTNGTIWTVAGNGSAGYSGDGGTATSAALNNPRSVSTFAGLVYIADTLNSTIRLLTPVVQAPAISSGGVVSASAFGGFAQVCPGSWIEIYGNNLASDMRSWGGPDFTGINAPTSLDGTTVTIGGKAAFIDFISPGQVNALVPSNVGTGPQQITVKTAAGTSAPVNVTVNAVQPGLLAPPSFTVNGSQYAVAFFSDGTYVLPIGAIAGLTSRPAMPGDTIVLYGVGFGPVTPNIPAGQLVEQSNTLASSLQMFVGGLPATAVYSGLAPNYTGLYQFNIVVPNVAAGNAVPLTFTLDGVPGTQTLSIAVQN